MTETFQILVSLLVVISAVAVVANRLQVPPSILLVLVGVGLALIPGLPDSSARPGSRPGACAAADRLFRRRGDELA